MPWGSPAPRCDAGPSSPSGRQADLIVRKSHAAGMVRAQSHSGRAAAEAAGHPTVDTREGVKRGGCGETYAHVHTSPSLLMHTCTMLTHTHTHTCTDPGPEPPPGWSVCRWNLALAATPCVSSALGTNSPVRREKLQCGVCACSYVRFCVPKWVCMCKLGCSGREGPSLPTHCPYGRPARSCPCPQKFCVLTHKLRQLPRPSGPSQLHTWVWKESQL